MDTNVFKQIFLNNVRQRREQAGLSIVELSQCSGVPLEMLEALEQGEIPEEMMVENAFDLAKVFGCETYELFR